MYGHAFALIATMLSHGGAVLQCHSRESVVDTRAVSSAETVELSKRALARSRLYSRRRGLHHAVEHLNTAIQVDPQAISYAERAHIRSLRGDDLGAMGDADYAIGLNPTLAVAYYYRGLIYSRMGLWVSATDDFVAAVFIDPNTDNGRLFDSLGSALVEQGRYTEAIASFSRAIDRRSRPALSYLNRSIAYERSGQIDAAISDMNAAIQAGSDDAAAYHRRARLFMRKGQFGQSLLDLSESVSRDHSNVGALTDRARVHEILGDGVAARSDFEYVRELSAEK